jgi:hypothetical protein
LTKTERPKEHRVFKDTGGPSVLGVPILDSPRKRERYSIIGRIAGSGAEVCPSKPANDSEDS